MKRPGDTVGKGNLRKAGYGKPALTLVEKTTNHAIRIAYRPVLQKAVGESAFLVKRGQGIELDGIPVAEQMEPVDLMWNAPEDDIMVIEDIFDRGEDWMSEIKDLVKFLPEVS